MPTEVNFQEFSYQDNSYQQPAYQYEQPNLSNEYKPVTFQSIKAAFSTGDDENEPPLLEELGVNFKDIFQKGTAVLNPFKKLDSHILDDADLAGPLVFCMLFGGSLLLANKAHFEYIYGVALIGWMSMYSLLNLMSETGIDIYRTASVLGYSLLPMVIISSCYAFIPNDSPVYGLVLSLVGVLWCANSASAMFVAHMNAADQRLLIAYPVGLVYGAFALLAAF
ncbi:hypothetical protein EDD86DRAFT_240261, partial [Gorgonomyces haynaldii]